ncbi:MAG: hypothetical protein R2725_04705 [Solirubrobacterales bacterium]
MPGKSFGKTISGRPITGDLIDELVARAEEGQPVEELSGRDAALVLGIDTRYTAAVVKDSDIYVLAGLLARSEPWSYRSLAERLRVPHPVVQRALARAKGADLYSPDRREVHRPHFEEYAIHALRFVAPAQLGPLVPGVPAAWAAEPMASAVRTSGEEPPPVWPYAQGRVRGQAIEPLHPAAPEAVEAWPEFGELLALLDSLRAGDARVRGVAGDLLSERLRSQVPVADR